MQRANKSCLLAAVILFLGCGPTSEAPSGDTESESHSRFLYVWAGAEEDSGSDFLAVIDADPESAGYGQVVASVPVGVDGRRIAATLASDPFSSIRSTNESIGATSE